VPFGTQNNESVLEWGRRFRLPTSPLDQGGFVSISKDMLLAAEQTGLAGESARSTLCEITGRVSDALRKLYSAGEPGFAVLP